MYAFCAANTVCLQQLELDLHCHLQTLCMLAKRLHSAKGYRLVPSLLLNCFVMYDVNMTQQSHAAGDSDLQKASPMYPS
jgi:hypothetical protein